MLWISKQGCDKRCSEVLVEKHLICIENRRNMQQLFMKQQSSPSEFSAPEGTLISFNGFIQESGECTQDAIISHQKHTEAVLLKTSRLHCCVWKTNIATKHFTHLQLFTIKEIVYKTFEDGMTVSRSV